MNENMNNQKTINCRANLRAIKMYFLYIIYRVGCFFSRMKMFFLEGRTIFLAPRAYAKSVTSRLEF